ncbi:MAG: GNAT family N-acetyltransferase [Steroidobacteraceae bacterium]|nr:GNAT family N-acetyltransferase [Steroidobacteraceae bacterium]
MNDSAISRVPPLSAATQLLAAAGLPTNDLTEPHCQHFFYLGPATAPTGLVGLEIYGDVALLRSLVVAPAERSAGAGSTLVRHAEEQARANGVRRLYLLTTTAEAFFSRRGYQTASREDAPVAIRTTREFAGICPASSAFMSKPL